MVQSTPVSPWTDLVETCKMFFTYRCGCLALLFFYTGFNQPYQLVTFGRFFNKQTQAVEQIIFYALEVTPSLSACSTLTAVRDIDHRGSCVRKDPR